MEIENYKVVVPFVIIHLSPSFVIFEPFDHFGRFVNTSMVEKYVRHVFDIRIAFKMFDVVPMHININPMCLHDAICQVYNVLCVMSV